MFETIKKDKSLVWPKNGDMITKVTNDKPREDEDIGILHTSPCRTPLIKTSNNIVKLCSPLFRVELSKKRCRLLTSHL
jgi:hypothetical protein